MASVTIRLNSIGEVKEFNRIAATVPGDVDLHSGRYCVDAKSIMGIFALNLARELTVDSPTPERGRTAQKSLRPFWRAKGVSENQGQHRTIPALRLKHRSGGCGTASALPKCSIIHKVLSALLA